MPASKAQRAATANRRTQAIALRLAGVDWETIADRLGYASRGAACTDVTRALADNLGDLRAQVDDLRTLEAARLDRMQATVWPQIRDGDPQVINTLLKITDRRMRLLGLDKPDTDERLAAISEEQAATIIAAVEAALSAAGVRDLAAREAAKHAAGRHLIGKD